LLGDLCRENALVLGEDRDGRVTIWAYDDGVPFTNNYFTSGSSEYLTLSAGIAFDDGMKLKTRVRNTDLSTERSICGGAGLNYKFIRYTSTGVVGEMDTDTNEFSINFLSALSNDVWYNIEIQIDGTDVKLYLDGVYQGTDTITSEALTFTRIMSGYSTSDLIGDMEYFCIINSDDSVKINLKSVNEKLVDTMGVYKFTETGTIAYSLSDKGTYDLYATTTSEEFNEMQILEDSFSFNKITDELANEIIANYYKNNDTLNYQATNTDSNSLIDRTITKELDLSYIADSTTADALIALMLDVNSKRAYVCKFDTGACGIGLDMFHAINVRHPLIRGVFTDMTSKKWIVCGLESSINPFKITVTAVELL